MKAILLLLLLSTCRTSAQSREQNMSNMCALSRNVYLKTDCLRKAESYYDGGDRELLTIKRTLEEWHHWLERENVPEYPRPEFHVSHLKHDTERGALCWIRTDGGFKDPHRGFRDPHKWSLVWWSLAVRPEEIQAAEMMLLKKTYPNQTKEQAAKQQRFLWRFATSPAFSEKSRYGSYRFTFPLQDVLTAYSKQFCFGATPIMRVFRTCLFKQEVQYSVLVHSPANRELFSDFPLLPGNDPNAVCAYRDGRLIWRSEAMCETHRYKLIHRPDTSQMHTLKLFRQPQFYLWDNVAMALHVENGQVVLKFDSDQLRENLKFCESDRPTITPNFYFDHFENAKILVNQLWPDSDTVLEEEPSLELSFKEED
ncbi:uncharacterized protein LOC120437722 isoform X1 [Oreochromis aureus]|uniref:uncharacterized protein LOC120437722 isoform X1 n=1 Tax=Oreochromis aureus TaxID=47969 RepID=UPI001954AE99|nr:uncharacterized protein LOC120437722 isoform X1 [Oreochromis aureus]